MLKLGMSRIACGPISFALQYRERDGRAPHSQNAGGRGRNHADQGVSIQVIGREGETETELLRFDCFENNPHDHYGPRDKNERIFLDTTLVPDALQWTLNLFKRGKLPGMLKHAGYPTIAHGLDDDLLASALQKIEAKVQTMLPADRG